MASQRQPSGDDAGDRAASGRPVDAHPLPPGPDGYPLVGNLPQLVRDPFAFYDDLATYGDVVRYRVAGKPFTTVLAPAHVERVLVEEHDRFERYLGADFGLEFAPDGLLFADGDQWRRQRQLMQPAFTLDRIRSYGAAMTDCTEETVEAWADGQVVALNETFSALTLRILASALFGVDVDPSGDDEAIARAARVINRRSDVRNATAFLPGWVPTPGNLRFRRAMRDYRERVAELIDRRRTDGPGGDDLLSRLLYAEGPGGETLSEAEVRDNLLTFMFAGHETTSLGLTYAVMALAHHDEVAAELRAELDAVLDGGSPGVEHLPDLEYTEHVVREALRCYPPAYITFRTVTEDALFDGYRVPEGTVLTLPQFRLHADERYWDDPDEFRPGRWAADRDRPEYAYFPFGGGPRHCIGMRFAMLELQLVVATLARRFDLTLLSDPDPSFSAGVTLQPTDDVRVRVDRRAPE